MRAFSSNLSLLLPKTCTRLHDEKIRDFLAYINNQIAAFVIPAGNIVNIDEKTSVLMYLDQGLWLTAAKAPLGFKQQEIQIIAPCC